MKILLAAGVFYPDVGGPAIHVRKIAERLCEAGIEVTVLAYGEDPSDQRFPFKVCRVSRKINKVLQWVLYFFHTLRFSFSSNLVYAFDPTAAGLPACLSAKFWGKPFIIRIGGDPIWEREAELGRRVMPINDYYKEGLYKLDKPLLFKIIRFILNQAETIVFYNRFWVDFYNNYYGISESKMSVVKNPIFKREQANPVLADDPVVIFAGRFVTYKNLTRVIKAFDKVRQVTGKGHLLLIGKGPEEESLKSLAASLGSTDFIRFIPSLPQEKLFEEVKNAAVALGPALSEFNPNFILESLSFGKPVLLSKGHGLSIDLPEQFIFDPLDEVELEKKLLYLFDEENYKNAVEAIAALEMDQTWEKVTNFHLDLVQARASADASNDGSVFKRLFRSSIVLRYLVAGTTGALTQIGSLYVLTDVVGIWYLYSSVLAFAVAIIISFTLQKTWTFEDKSINKIPYQFAKYMVLALTGLALNSAFMFVLVDIVNLWYILAQFIVSLVIAVINFLAYKFFVFRK